MDDDRISERLRQVRERSGLSVRALAHRLGVPTSTYANYEARFKKAYLPMEFAEELARALSGTGATKDEVMALAGVVPRRVENNELAPSGSKLVPVCDVTASAGHGAINDYEAVAYSLAFPSAYLQKVTGTHPRNLAIISVKGDSMEPTLKDDDIVMVDMSKKNIGYDGMFVVWIRVTDVLKIKRLRVSPDRTTITLLSDNHITHPPESWPAEEVEVIGRVRWVGGKV